LRLQLARQVGHWAFAARRLQNLDSFASAGAWNELEAYLGAAVRRTLSAAAARLREQAARLHRRLQAAADTEQLETLRLELVRFRKQYLQTEVVIDYYGDAVVTRADPETAALLRACDILAAKSMQRLLEPLDKEVPPLLSYLDKGLGASILKAGLRLWDGRTISPAAAVKVTRHNLLRPTAVIHEAGHQVAHILNWNEELAAKLSSGLPGVREEVTEMWSGWASEIAADAFAFVNTGYAAVAALHDVLAGDGDFVFRYTPGDPHPISYIRVLLGVEMCRHSFGPGPWDGLAAAWKLSYPLQPAAAWTGEMLQQSLPLLPRFTGIILDSPLQAFNGRSLTGMIDTAAVRPEALARLEQTAGPALYTSPHWLWNEALRLLALSGLRIALRTGQGEIDSLINSLEKEFGWMKRLGLLSGPAA
jgi:hypothetical protein